MIQLKNKKNFTDVDDIDLYIIQYLQPHELLKLMQINTSIYSMVQGPIEQYSKSIFKHIPKQCCGGTCKCLVTYGVSKIRSYWGDTVMEYKKKIRSRIVNGQKIIDLDPIEKYRKIHLQSQTIPTYDCKSCGYPKRISGKFSMHKITISLFNDDYINLLQELYRFYIKSYIQIKKLSVASRISALKNFRATISFYGIDDIYMYCVENIGVIDMNKKRDRSKKTFLQCKIMKIKK